LHIVTTFENKPRTTSTVLLYFRSVFLSPSATDINIFKYISYISLYYYSRYIVNIAMTFQRNYKVLYVHVYIWFLRALQSAPVPDKTWLLFPNDYATFIRQYIKEVIYQSYNIVICIIYIYILYRLQILSVDCENRL